MYKIIDYVMERLKCTIYDGIDENRDLFPTLNIVNSLIISLDEYSIKDIDESLFNSIVLEVIDYLK